jgi:hypothetical protein
MARRLAAALFALGALLLASAGRAHAQTAEDNIAKAIAAYENLEVQAALRTFLQVVSPTSPFPVTESQRVTAFKYMGAAYATLDKKDSAAIFFQGAILRDPFTDLDPTKFTDKERSVFADAKKALFRVAARFDRDSIPAGSGHAFTFHAVTSHAGRLTLAVQRTDTAPAPIVRLFSGQDIDGPRDIAWNGTGPDGQALPQGIYDLIITGESQLGSLAGRQDSVRYAFQLRWLHEPLETALRPLKADELLPEKASGLAPFGDLAKGLLVGGTVFLAGNVLGNAAKVGAGIGTGAVAAGIAAGAGLIALVQRSNDRSIPENVAENGRRNAARDAINNERAARNDARLAAKTLLLIPALGAR